MPIENKTLLALLVGLVLAEALLAIGTTWQGIAGLDQALLASIAGHQSLGVARAWSLVTDLGNTIVVFPLALATIIFLYLRAKKTLALRVAATMAMAILLENGLKFAVHRARPIETYLGTMPPSFSFPSGHTLFATAFYLGTALAVSPALPQNQRWPWLVLAVMLATAIGLSRIGLLVHYPTDVAGGAIAGLIAIILGKLVANTMAQREKR